jgi:hypothetical protein
MGFPRPTIIKRAARSCSDRLSREAAVKPLVDALAAGASRGGDRAAVTVATLRLK